MFIHVPGHNADQILDHVPELSDLGNIFGNEDELSGANILRHKDWNCINSSNKMEESDISTSFHIQNAKKICSSACFRGPLQTSRPIDPWQEKLRENNHSPPVKTLKRSQLQQQFQQERSQRLKYTNNDNTSATIVTNNANNGDGMSNELSSPSTYFLDPEIQIPSDAIIETISSKRHVIEHGEIKKFYKVGDQHVLMSSKERYIYIYIYRIF